jgi:hypothetical protein
VNEERQEVWKALWDIMADRKSKGLVWATGYVQVGIHMIEGENEDHVLKVQLLYILNNISHWRGPGNKEARAALKMFIKNH